MLASQSPDRIPLAFATSGTKNTIPEQAADITNPNDASFEAGFPPVTMTPVSAGGIPPNGADFNGVLFALSALGRWQSAGGQFKYNSAFANDTNVGGYPKGAFIESADGSTLWLCLADNNTTDPDSGTAANWASLASYGIASVTGLTNANVTLTPAQYSKPIITLAGTLTGNVQVILPAHQKQWTIVNNCAGAFTVTVKTASGTGVIVPGSGSIQIVYGDGTNIVSSGVLTQSVADTRYAPLLAAVPTGTILDYAGTTVPNGFLQCPTAVTNVSRTTYAALFAILGTTWGAGDGSTTFGIPYFPADQTGVQANGNVGTNTVGEVITHSHQTADSAITNNVSLNAGGPSMRNSGSIQSGSTGGAANLPAGMRVMKIVKY
jgi:microcystin-dependent protein